MRKLLIVFLSLISFQFFSCHMTEKSFDIEGHRGCRGLMPENTLPAFQKALELGVNTLELDLAVSKDQKLVVSHEPYFNSVISLDPNGNEIPKDQELSHNMFQMDYDSIRLYEVGLKADPRFRERVDVSAYRPLLSEVFDLAMTYSETSKTPLVDFNIEIKRLPEYDNLYHPDADVFSSLLLDLISEYQLTDRCIIQSFDLESLQQVKRKNPGIRTVLLIENDKSPEANIAALGFTPTIYSPHFIKVNQELMAYAKLQNMLVIPWTVNEPEDIKSMISLKVDGIISDYPDRVISLRKK